MIADSDGSEYVPGEILRWHPAPGQLHMLLDSFMFDADTAASLPGLMARLNAVMKSGSTAFPRQYRDFFEVADRFLTVGYHRFSHEETPMPGAMRDDTRPFMHPSDAVARLAACAEKLMMGDQKGDLSRATSQRAAIVVGRTDDQRLTTLEMTKAMYSMRSHHVHVNPKKDDRFTVAEVRELVRHIIIGWMILTADHGPALPEVLDKALVSQGLRQEKVDEPIMAFWDSIPSAGSH